MTSYFNGIKAGLCRGLKERGRSHSSDSGRLCGIARLVFIYEAARSLIRTGKVCGEPRRETESDGTGMVDGGDRS